MRPKRLTFSEESKMLITDMGNTEIFELCETSSKTQCPVCNFYKEIVENIRKVPKSWTRRTSTPYQVQVTSSKRTSPVVPNMELPNGNECTTKPRRCCRKLANPIMVGTKPFWKDATRTTNTASLCQKLSGLKSRLFNMTNLHWKTTLILQQERKELETRKVGYSS